MEEKNERIIVTGSSRFIGFNLSKSLLEEGDKVVGIDNVNDYYSVELKESRLKKLNHKNFKFNRIDLEYLVVINDVFERNQPNNVINLPAQTWVLYSLENPPTYINSNIVGFTNIFRSKSSF